MIEKYTPTERVRRVKKGEPNGRIIHTDVRKDAIYKYHATKGWRRHAHPFPVNEQTVDIVVQ